MLVTHIIFRNKTKNFSTLPFTQREPISTVVLHSTDSGEVTHTERSRWLHDSSHKIPSLTICTISIVGLQLYTDIQILLTTVEQ